MDLDRVSVPLEGWFAFVRENFRELFGKLLRVNIYVVAAVLLAAVAVLAGVAALLYTALGTPGWVLLALCILVAIILLIASRLFALASYKVVEEEHGEKRPVDIMGVAVQKAVPAVLYGIALLAIYAVVLIPLGLLGLVLTIATGTVGFIGPLIQLGIMVASLLVGIFLLFGPFELVLADKGPLESMRASFGLVRRNFWETLVFYVLRAVVNWAVSVPFAIALVILAVIAMLLGVGGIALAAGLHGFAPVLIVIAVVLVVLVLILFALAYNSAEETAVLPLTYRYWRTLRGDMKAAPSGTVAPAETAAAPAPPSQSRAIMATPESGPVLVAPVAGAMATMPSQKPMATQPTAKPAAKKAPPKKPAPKRAAKSR